MPAPAVYGLGSGQDHSKTIEKLLQLERIPIKRMERQNQRMEITIKAWKEAHGRARKLSDKSRMLYSFLGPFALKSVVSSDPGAITGKATAQVETGTHRMEVLELATRHQVHANRMETEEKLPAGAFTIHRDDQKQTIDFAGGTPGDLVRLLEEKAGDLYEVFKVQTDATGMMFGLRSKVTGKKGELTFADPGGLLQRVGLIGPASGERETQPFKIQSEEARKVSPAAKTSAKDGGQPTDKKASDAETAGFALLNGGQELRLEPGQNVRVERTIPATGKLLMTAELAGKQPAKAGGSMAMESVAGGPNIEVKVGNVQLRGYEVERSRTIMEGGTKGEPDPQASIVLHWKQSGIAKSKTIELKEASTDLEVDVSQHTGGQPLVALEFQTNPSARAVFRQLKLDAPKQIAGGLVAANVTSPARDARLKLEGVEVTRPTNDDITDIIKGASLNLRKKTTGAVVVTIQPDSEEIVKRIRDWVEAYNDLVKFCRENSKANAPEELSSARAADGDLEKSMERVRNSSGIFTSDSTIRTLVNNVQTVASAVYPAPEKPGYRVLSDVGISTGEAGIGNFRSNRFGLLVLDEKKLKEALATSAEAVKSLFASDTNADARIDNGAAHRMHSMLKPYSQVSGGMIGVRIQLLNDRIADNKKRIANKELHLEKVEENLRRKFGGMETYIRRSRETGNFLRQRLQTGGN